MDCGYTLQVVQQRRPGSHIAQQRRWQEQCMRELRPAGVGPRGRRSPCRAPSSCSLPAGPWPRANFRSQCQPHGTDSHNLPEHRQNPPVCMRDPPGATVQLARCRAGRLRHASPPQGGACNRHDLSADRFARPPSAPVTRPSPRRTCWPPARRPDVTYHGVCAPGSSARAVGHPAQTHRQAACRGSLGPARRAARRGPSAYRTATDRTTPSSAPRRHNASRNSYWNGWRDR